VINFVADRVAPYKKIRKVEFVEQLPKSPTGKLLRQVLRSANGASGIWKNSDRSVADDPEVIASWLRIGTHIRPSVVPDLVAFGAQDLRFDLPKA